MNSTWMHTHTKSKRKTISSRYKEQGHCKPTG